MNIVSDEIYYKTIEKTKNILKNILKQNQNIQNNSGKTVIINTMPTFSFRFLIIFVLIGEYLKKSNFNVKYIFDNSVFNHCDMVTMQENIDKEFLCYRCRKATEEFNQLSDDFIYLSDFNNDYTENKNISKEYPELEWSKSRYAGELDFPHYNMLSIQNLKYSESIAKNLYEKFNPVAYICLTHHSMYSISPISKYFNFKGVSCINIGGSTYKEKGISFFTKSTDATIKNKIINGLNFNNNKIDAIEKFLEKRVSVEKFNDDEQVLINKLKIVRESGKKIVAVFPNVMDDAVWSDYHTIFNSVQEWIEETISFLLKNNFYVVLRAHPSEANWNLEKGVISYIKERFTSDSILYIEANKKLKSYSFLEYIDAASLYTGTLIMECIYKKVPVVIGGNSYIIENVFNNKIDKNEYLNKFLILDELKREIDEKYLEILKFAYIDFFCRDIAVEFINPNISYPNIELSMIENITKEYKPFKLIKSIINDDFDIEEYIDILEIKLNNEE